MSLMSNEMTTKGDIKGKERDTSNKGASSPSSTSRFPNWFSLQVHRAILRIIIDPIFHSHYFFCFSPSFSVRNRRKLFSSEKERELGCC
ncbi:hypothetical protein SLA2020_195070 [Shorea laevis]